MSCLVRACKATPITRCRTSQATAAFPSASCLVLRSKPREHRHFTTSKQALKQFRQLLQPQISPYSTISSYSEGKAQRSLEKQRQNPPGQGSLLRPSPCTAPPHRGARAARARQLLAAAPSRPPLTGSCQQREAEMRRRKGKRRGEGITPVRGLRLL